MRDHVIFKKSTSLLSEVIYIQATFRFGSEYVGVNNVVFSCKNNLLEPLFDTLRPVKRLDAV